MLRSFSCRHAASGPLREMRRLSTSTSLRSQVPNARLELDPAFDDFVKNAPGMSNWKGANPHGNKSRTPRELEIYPNDPLARDSYLTSEELDATEVVEERLSRKSPAARFGSQQHGAVVLPSELQTTITKLISGLTHKPPRHWYTKDGYCSIR